MTLLKSFLSDDAGATAIEYGLFAGLISVVLIGVLVSLGARLTAVFELIGQQLPV